MGQYPYASKYRASSTFLWNNSGWRWTIAGNDRSDFQLTITYTLWTSRTFRPQFN
jgi:hypothetical protein